MNTSKNIPPMNSPDNFDQKLIAQQSINAAFRENYQKEIAAMLETKMTPAQRKIHIPRILITLACMFMFGTIALGGMFRPPLPVPVRVGAGILALLAPFWAAVLLRRFLRGTIDHAAQQRARAFRSRISPAVRILLAFMIIYMIMNAQHIADPTEALKTMALGITFLLLLISVGIQNQILISRQKTEEKILELQLQVAELAEKLNKSP